MRGHCADCRAWQAKGIADYQCVLCTLELASRVTGMPIRLVEREGLPTVIDLSGEWARPQGGRH